MEYDTPDQELDSPHLVLLVTGAHLRSEIGDRPLAYRLKKRIEAWQRRHNEQLGVQIKPVVCSDLWYLNNEALQQLPTVSVGGPGVNALSALFAKQLPEDENGDGDEIAGDVESWSSNDEIIDDEDSGDNEETVAEAMADGDQPKVVIQIDPDFTDLRACIWGTNNELTEAGIRVFTKRYLDGFLRAVATQVEPRE